MASLRFRERDALDKKGTSDSRARPILFVILVLISIVLLSRWGVRQENPIASRLTFLITPVQTKTRQWFNQLKDSLHFWKEISDNRLRIEQLERENQSLKRQLATVTAVESENSRLRRLSRLAERYPWYTLPATVIGRGGEQLQTLLLDRGSRDGVLVNQPVVTYEGLVGRVYAVRPHACLVLQITDPNSSVGVFACPQPDEAVSGAITGVLSGQGKKGLLLEPKDGVAIPKDWPVYTSSISTIYPAGLRLGIVQGEIESGYSLQRRLRVKAMVDFDQLREVLILTRMNREEARQLQQGEESQEIAGPVGNATP